MHNRSIPVDTVLPHIVYQDVGHAIAWLTDRFGFTEHYRYGDPAAPGGAQMHLGNAWVMLSTAREGRTNPETIGAWTQSLTVFVDDVEAHYRHSKGKGIQVVEEPHETMYGEFQYAAEDLEGHLWIFSRHAKDIAPEQWGAIVARS